MPAVLESVAGFGGASHCIREQDKTTLWSCGNEYLRRRRRAILNAQIDFIWRGTDRRGKPAQGEIAEASLALAKARLRRRGIRPALVRRKPRPLFGIGRERISAADIAIFTRQLATMIRSAIPLVQALTIMAASTDNASLRALILRVRDDVAGGRGLADSMARHPRRFDSLYCSLIAAGESSGTLETMLDRLAGYREKSERLKSRIRKALTYPAAVVCVALAVTMVLLTRVVPVFAETFAGFDAELPPFTRFVLHLSDLAAARWRHAVAVALAAAGASIWLPRHSARADALRQRLLLRLPVVGPLLRNAAVARFSRTLATLFRAGAPLTDALERVAEATGNAVYADAVRVIREDVRNGQSLTGAIRAAKLFPPMLEQLVGIGEESGALDDMLDKCAGFYEEDVENRVDRLTALLEPFIMAALGLLVGGLMIAMYLPIFRLGSVL